MDDTEAAWTDLMTAAARLIALKPDASSLARRDGTCLVAIWPDAKHDLDHWPPRAWCGSSGRTLADGTVIR